MRRSSQNGSCAFALKPQNIGRPSWHSMEGHATRPPVQVRAYSYRSRTNFGEHQVVETGTGASIVSFSCHEDFDRLEGCSSSHRDQSLTMQVLEGPMHVTSVYICRCTFSGATFRIGVWGGLLHNSSKEAKFRGVGSMS